MDTRRYELRKRIALCEIPQQPPAGKLQYRVYLQDSIRTVALPADGSIIIRFKGAVPMLCLFFISLSFFSAMLFSTRTGIEIFALDPHYTGFTYWTITLLFVAG